MILILLCYTAELRFEYNRKFVSNSLPKYRQCAGSRQTRTDIVRMLFQLHQTPKTRTRIFQWAAPTGFEPVKNAWIKIMCLTAWRRSCSCLDFIDAKPSVSISFRKEVRRDFSISKLLRQIWTDDLPFRMGRSYSLS